MDICVELYDNCSIYDGIIKFYNGKPVADESHIISNWYYTIKFHNGTAIADDKHIVTSIYYSEAEWCGISSAQWYSSYSIGLMFYDIMLKKNITVLLIFLK